MDFQCFVGKAVRLFQAKKGEKQIAENVFRGRAARCDSDIENLIAVAISEIIPKEYTLLVDYPISISASDGNRAKTYYPDIAVVYDNCLLGIVEVKIDLGYVGDNWVSESKKIVMALGQASQLFYNANVGTPKSSKEKIASSTDLLRTVIVLSGKNHPGRVASFRKQDNCFILMPNYHPNSSKIEASQVNQFIADIAKKSSGWGKMEKHFRKKYPEKLTTACSGRTTPAVDAHVMSL